MHVFRTPANFRTTLASTPADRTQGRVRFLLVQLFALIFFQKLAVGTQSFQLSVPMLVMFAGVAWMLPSGGLSFVPARLVTYFAFVCLSLLSQILAGASGSIPSMTLLIVLYSLMTVRMDLPEEAYRQVLRRFIAFMVLPAVIIIIQYTYQRATGRCDPISMTPFVPKNFLMQGFLYDAHYPWDSTFSRPNGFFFLEPSWASAFVATAAILEFMYFKRAFMLGLMLAATLLTLGGTGITILIIAAPFLLARQPPRVAAVVVTVVVAAVVIAYMLNLPLPLVSRLDEFHGRTTSGNDRLLKPASELIPLISNPAFLFTGTGAGTTTSDLGSIWPIVKVTLEYGTLTAVSFLVFYFTSISGTANVALAVALSVIFHATGNYLLNPILVEMLVLFCFIVAPVGPLTTPHSSPAGSRPGHAPALPPPRRQAVRALR